jgi:hypothetical protein
LFSLQENTSKDVTVTPEIKQEFKEWKKEREKNRHCAYDHPHKGKHNWIYD